jgi:hypothetical protein
MPTMSVATLQTGIAPILFACKSFAATSKVSFGMHVTRRCCALLRNSPIFISSPLVLFLNVFVFGKCSRSPSPGRPHNSVYYAPPFFASSTSLSGLNIVVERGALEKINRTKRSFA